MDFGFIVLCIIVCELLLIVFFQVTGRSQIEAKLEEISQLLKEMKPKQ
jgi:hypothetical protein